MLGKSILTYLFPLIVLIFSFKSIPRTSLMHFFVSTEKTFSLFHNDHYFIFKHLATKNKPKLPKIRYSI